QWQYQNVGSTSWAKSSQSGSTTDTLTVPITAARDGQKYRCVVKDADGNTLTSDAAAIHATEATVKITITSQPEDYTGEIGTKATFKVVAEGNSELTYQWQYQNVGSNAWQKSSQSGSTTDTLTVPITAARDGQKYRCVVKDADGNTLTSDAAAIHATEATVKITITSQPEDYTGAIGTNATFKVVAEGNSELTYQWQYQNVGSSSWAKSSQSGSTTDTLTVPITAARDGQKYRCVIKDADGNTVTSNAASIIVG
ncbi:immunoglobulin domain-containing protein, partial [Butyricicoccus sp.]|uniref:immunoglobulin domain-containing protein n=1 Tax=Butyricicoccus sp. TaxID=2049021 RepID=UPI003F18604D